MEAFALPHQHGGGAHAEELERYLNRMEDFQTVTLVFRQLADANRVRLFWTASSQNIENLPWGLVFSTRDTANRIRANRTTPERSLSLYYRVVVIKAPLQGLCYTVRDAVDWLFCPTARRFSKGSNRSPLQDC